MMQVIRIGEYGYNSALYGFSLSYKDRAIDPEKWWCPLEIRWDKHMTGDAINERCPGELVKEDIDCDTECQMGLKKIKMEKTATANAGRGKGHDKWLRQVMVWLDIEAPRYWWSEFDTYKVGTVAQSESTMHTLSRRDLTPDDFEGTISYFDIDTFNLFRKASNADIQSLKQELPEAYLQRRVVTLNYAVLRCIIEQRKNHRLPEWHTFIDAIYTQVDHPELLPKREE